MSREPYPLTETEQQVAASGCVDELAESLVDAMLALGKRGTDIGYYVRIGDRTNVLRLLLPEFERIIAREWLPERERAASEKAWDECFDACSAQLAEGINPGNRNPYRERADREE